MSRKRIAWARAFSSDMWFTPKNWLSPKSSRSITFSRSPSPKTESFCPLWAHGLEDGPISERRGALPGVRDQHANDLVCDPRTFEAIDAVRAPLLHALDEGVDLGAVLLATQVEPH